MTDKTKPEDLARREAALRADRLRFDLERALTSAKRTPAAITDTTALLAGSVQAEFDDNGRIVKLTLGETEYQTPTAAAEAFIEARPWLMTADDASSIDDDQGDGTTPTPSAPTVDPDGMVAKAFNMPPPAAKVVPQPKTAKLPKGKSALELVEAGYNASDIANDGWSSDPGAA